MKRISMLIGALLLAAPCFGQLQQGSQGDDVHRMELALIPYSYAQLLGFDMHGAGGSVALHLNPTVALVGDFGLHRTIGLTSIAGFSIDSEIFTYRGGIRLTKRGGRSSLYAQVLVGGLHVRDIARITGDGVDLSGKLTIHGWAGSLGGGVDVGIRHWLSYRVVSAEWMPTYFHDTGNVFHGAKLSTGFVFHLH